MNQKMNGHEFIAQTLKGYGITHIFYVEAMLRMAMRSLGDLGVKRIMAHTENAAAYMADGYARASNKPSVCMAQSIGSANLAGGIHEAWLAKSPVIALTGKKTPPYQYRGSYQEADHRLLYEGITKFNADVSQSEQLPVVLRQLFREAVTSMPRPVHADMTNHTGRTVEVGSVYGKVFVEKEYTQYPAFRPSADQASVEKAAKEINDSSRPVIVIGRGAALSGAGNEIISFARKSNIPIVTTPDGKTVVDETDTLWRGIVGSYGMDCANKTVQAADLVIFIGTQAGDQTTFDWKVPTEETRVIQIDISPSELGRNYPNSIGLLGDAKVVVSQLFNTINIISRNKWLDLTEELLQNTLSEYLVRQTDESELMRPERLCYEISKALSQDAVLVSDTGYSAVWSSTMIRMRASQKYFRAAGSLGWSYPASLGIKCALPDVPVICFTGDGAFYYHMSEMETAVRYGINTVTIINNNHGLVQCRPDLSLVYKDAANQIERRYCYPDNDFCKIANALGCWSKRITDWRELEATIKEALASNRPAIIDVVTDRAADVPKAL